MGFPAPGGILGDAGEAVEFCVALHGMEPGESRAEVGVISRLIRYMWEVEGGITEWFVHCCCPFCFNDCFEFITSGYFVDCEWR